MYRWNEFDSAGGETTGEEKEPSKRKSMQAMDKIVLVLEGTVEGRGAAGGVQYTQNECCTIFEHYCNNGVAGQNRAGQQVEKAFADRANQVFRLQRLKARSGPLRFLQLKL